MQFNNNTKVKVRRRIRLVCLVCVCPSFDFVLESALYSSASSLSIYLVEPPRATSRHRRRHPRRPRPSPSYSPSPLASPSRAPTMDLVLEYADAYAFDAAYAYLFPAPSSPSSSNATLSSLPSSPSSAYASRLARDAIPRQLASLFIIALSAALVLYFLFCSLSYYFLYDRRLEHHPKFLKNQIRQEIVSSLIAAPVIDVLTLPWFLGEVRGYSKLYDHVADRGWAYFVFSAVWFLVFTDFMIYWIHRLEVSPRARAEGAARGEARRGARSEARQDIERSGRGRAGVRTARPLWSTSHARARTSLSGWPVRRRDRPFGRACAVTPRKHARDPVILHSPPHAPPRSPLSPHLLALRPRSLAPLANAAADTQHHKLIYKYIHKPHHKWIVPTPYAALAFHPLDGYAQSLPYQ